MMFNMYDYDKIQSKLKNIIDDAEKKSTEILEPKLGEFKDVQNIIIGYAVKKKRIIYGGFAINQYIKGKNTSNAIYNDYNYVDVEFYGHKPIKDIIKICNEIHKKGYKHTIAKSANHIGTFKIFVNFQAYCDITYVGKKIYGLFPFIMINDYKLININLIQIDKFRMFCDPMLSYWRLDKELKRFNIIENHYPYIFPSKINIDKNQSSHYSSFENLIFNYIKILHPYKSPNKLSNEKSLISSILLYLSGITNYVLCSDIAFNSYCEINYDNVEHIHIITSEYNEVVGNIELLVKKMNAYYIKLKFLRFFQHIDHRCDFFILSFDHVLKITIQGNYDICVPFNIYHYSNVNESYGLKIAGADYVILTFMIQCFYYFHIFGLWKHHVVNLLKNDNLNVLLADFIKCHRIYHYNYIIDKFKSFVEFRNNFLKQNNLSIIDNSKFQSFITNCTGFTLTPIRQYKFLMNDENTSFYTKKLLTFSFDPSIDIKSRKLEYKKYLKNIDSGTPV